MKLRITLLLTLFLPALCLFAQESTGRMIPSTPRFAIKSNLLYDATATLNLGIEFKTGRKFTIDIPANYNAWTFSENRKWKHFLVQPELRYWLCEPFHGHHLGIHGHYGQYNVGNLPFGGHLKEYRYEGWLAGGGLSYGYHWLLSNRWSLEAGIGVGYAYLSYDKYPCDKCGDLLNKNNKHYVGITKAAISLIYIIK
ncbi:DUF3575 domain-containing protein [Bacteroides sp. 224]|uniref:DUF3575 domain-containing protein n=1 Tax=Bacteroides sp. 224 TaxID=2302936 RepID=UPI0013D5CF26|nr:DUF3575 domain-containing protein [Bacteroides sp. 224]NDV66760.1 DUF3575 domain-containing protein [Bacteroides sp. 224]